MNDKINNSSENPSKVYALFYSFFLIPFMLAIFGALFFFMFQFLTYEKNTPLDLLENIQAGSATKRWQSAFELSNMLDKSKIEDMPTFINKLKFLFEKSQYDDPRVRTYLALAMGKTKNLEFGDILISALDDSNLTNRIAAIKSLGAIKYKPACLKLKKIINNSVDNSEKLAAIISLGDISAPEFSDVLINMLDNEEPNLRWDAAIALAKMGRREGVPIINRLLSRSYYEGFPPERNGRGIDENEVNNSIYIAISITRKLVDQQFNEKLEFLSKNDKNIKIREFALKTLNDYYK